MKFKIESDGVKREIHALSYNQSRQAAAVMDCIGRMIPQEGIDYDVEIVFNGQNDHNVSMNILCHTDKGEWWRNYVMKMISKYPPTVENPGPSIPIDTHEKNEEDSNEEIVP